MGLGRGDSDLTVPMTLSALRVPWGAGAGALSVFSRFASRLSIFTAVSSAILMRCKDAIGLLCCRDWPMVIATLVDL